MRQRFRRVIQLFSRDAARLISASSGSRVQGFRGQLFATLNQERAEPQPLGALFKNEPKSIEPFSIGLIGPLPGRHLKRVLLKQRCTLSHTPPAFSVRFKMMRNPN